MEIAKVKEYRDELADKLTEFVKDFEMKTGCAVSDIQIVKLQKMNGETSVARIVVDVEI